MINSLHGKVISVNDEYVVLDVLGFGIEVYATGSLLSSAIIGEDLFCYAYMQVSDAGICMFGFSSEREKAFFLELLQVKTVGGKLAITLLRHLDAEQALHAISSGSAAMLSVPGLGAKRAERICFELKNKIAKKFSDINTSGEPSANPSVERFVMDALTGLGFTQSESIRAIAVTKASDNGELPQTEEAMLKAALSILQRR